MTKRKPLIRMICNLVQY